MKYLRAFNESLESNEWYQQITWDEYKDLSTIEPFNKKEVEVIKDYINDNKSDSIDIDTEKDEEGDVYEFNVRSYKGPRSLHYSSITIHKLEDDFFLLRDNPNSQGTANYFYKADQLEGLIKLLQQVVLYNF